MDRGGCEQEVVLPVVVRKEAARESQRGVVRPDDRGP